MTTTLQPLQQDQRDINLDILRGFAMAGVLFVYCAGDMGISGQYVNSFWDESIKWFKWVMVEGRMYGMLILVFGIGFSVQLRKANQKGESLVPFFSRRLAGLLLIGFIHAIFLSNRDILLFYGIAGFALLPARNFSNRQLLFYILFIFALSLALPYILQALGTRVAWKGQQIQPNNYPEYIRFNWGFFIYYHKMASIYLEMLLFFLIGFYVDSSGWLYKIKTNKKLRDRILFVSLMLSAVLAVFMYGWFFANGFVIILKNINANWLRITFKCFAALLSLIMMLSFILFYASVLISLNTLETGKKILKPVAVFGQMAMSNYLIQSLVIVPYALWYNKFDNMPPVNGTVLFVIVFTLQLLMSSWWLRHFRFGPFEWLLRSFTYWKWQPIKRNTNVLQTEIV